MTESGSLSEADRSLLADLTALGLTVTARQLRRWRAEHLIPSPMRIAAGRGQGRRSVTYPDGTVEQATLVAALLRQGLSVRDVRFELLWRGTWELPISVIRADLRDLLERLIEELPQTPDPDDAPDVFVNQKFRAFTTRTERGRAQIARSGTYGARRGSNVESALVGAMELMFGTVKPSQIDIDAVASVFGMHPDLAVEAMEVAAVPSVPALLERLPDVTMENVIRAREAVVDYLFVLEWLKDDPRLEAVAPGLTDAIDDSAWFRAALILIVDSIIQAIPEWPEVFSEAARELRETGDLRILSQ